jgi:hypothetical protein
MEHEQVADTLHELAEFATTTAKTLDSHKGALQRHEQILLEAFESGMSHKQAIETIRKDVSALGELVNAQSALVASMQNALLKIAKALGHDPEELGPVN